MGSFNFVLLIQYIDTQAIDYGKRTSAAKLNNGYRAPPMCGHKTFSLSVCIIMLAMFGLTGDRRHNEEGRRLADANGTLTTTDRVYVKVNDH